VSSRELRSAWERLIRKIFETDHWFAPGVPASGSSPSSQMPWKSELCKAKAILPRTTAPTAIAPTHRNAYNTTVSVAKQISVHAGYQL
jgi:hypothetical protein